ncbi:ABC transporter substrate-binding protein [Ruminococcaceae bacterium OttesenSCG-928-O06]|nr:ABC transporter substrate-binding protein [Ruminococcaceae bacterium OttesenSCG-928-O06]
MKNAICLFLGLVLLCAGFAGCTGGTQRDVVYIAEQFGTAYAPIALMREWGLLEEHLPAGVRVEWSQVGNTAAIREAMLAGKADIGCMAIPPFLIGKDAGMEWKICSGISNIPMGLVSRDAEVQSLADIGSRRIALPQPGSIQHILLAMAAARQLGDATVFDNQLVTMSHPDGMTALLSGADVDLHFTTAPYLGQELAAGMTLVLDGTEAMGEPFTGIVAVASDAFAEENPALYSAFLAALQEAITRLNEDPAEAARLLAPVYGMEEDALLAELCAEGTAYTTAVEGVEAFATFLQQTGYTGQAWPLEELVAAE